MTTSCLGCLGMYPYFFLGCSPWCLLPYVDVNRRGLSSPLVDHFLPSVGIVVTWRAWVSYLFLLCIGIRYACSSWRTIRSLFAYLKYIHSPLFLSILRRAIFSTSHLLAQICDHALAVRGFASHLGLALVLVLVALRLPYRVRDIDMICRYPSDIPVFLGPLFSRV